ncbi:aminotransferase class V-fold PLP-dependent enzyme [Hirschia baltica]|uniref:Aminotransferase class V n=1 Tax=Hirschia baltica (strain ATCC 49814 / DSM 5838 / IFAM 1418) TaxID=582402 RepID=C6XPT3_HIRBI|nr:aminotransferase class V-fold PLP-dependent enzyme [Hirschia baltica]ACT60348.1 aminotransferase class V [Hirschia baltica ATCC 49814]
MKMTRRNYLTLSTAGLAGAVSACAYGANSEAYAANETVTNFPDRHSFDLGKTVYLNAASQHPMLRQSQAEIDAYLAHKKTFAPGDDYHLNTKAPIEKFAKLVNVDPSDLTYVQSTTAGEQAILRSLGLPKKGAKIVTDTLHFFASLPVYADFEKKGCEVTWVKARDNKIHMEDMEKAIQPGTKLVALSLVSTFNGFQHDLKAVCDLAHSRGALVYADIIHAAGCIPLDLSESGVDFAACASYKWLMGDFGLGFLYASKAGRAHLERSNWGYYGMSEFKSHIYPFDPPSDTIVDYAFSDDTSGWFALGTYNHVTAAQLNGSLEYILAHGVDKIQSHANLLTAQLVEGMQTRGFDVITPEGTSTPIVAAAYQDAREKLGARFKDAGISTSISTHRIRPSVSVFNTSTDIEHFLDVLGNAQ